MNSFEFLLLILWICNVQTNNITVAGNTSILPESSNDTRLNLIKFGDLCGRTVSETQFLLESPNYPETYPPELNCEVTLENFGDCPVYYKFRFLDFNVETSPGCIKDRLEIGFEDAICGFKNGTKTYFAKNGTLKLKFVTDNSTSAKGYKILVTRIEECVKKSQDSPNVLLTMPNLHPNLDKCCLGTNAGSKHFFLKSPGFPVSMSSKKDCVLEVIKSSPNICRIRMKFHFFWLGNLLDCREGFLEIDGKIVCGCQKELNLISTFTTNVKVIRFKSEGIVKNSYSGFIAEIHQDECPKKVESRTIQSSNNFNRTKRFLFNRFLQNSYPNAKYDVYIYTYPEYEYGNRQKDREETNFVEVETMDNFQGNSASLYPACLRWNQYQFDTIFTDTEIRLEKCESNEINYGKHCMNFHEKKGFFVSPGYPFFYSGNSNTCYRFLKLQGHCELKIHFLDFRIGLSEVCSEDRIEIENEGVYCGTALFNRVVRMPFNQLPHLDVNFFSTISRCFQGFKAVFEQIPCENPFTEQPPPRPITKIVPVEPTTFIPPFRCERLIREKFFTIFKEVNQECTFLIEKHSKNVCQLLLEFEQFSLDCAHGNLVINGESYCGNRAGDKINIEFENTPIKIHYKQFGLSASQQIFFEINGIQDTTHCDEPEVPAQIS